ncbi:MAG: StlD/DarB family beta-ketosynthase [Bdellovibrionaceae bacterium]|nr:StlD/DarB family beta-ketosynthase [Bdellovibrio sp.]
MTRSVYINATQTFFPNSPVSNDEIENVLGVIGDRPSRSKNVVLGSNQIKTRYYAIDPATRKPTHSNAQLAALAIKNLYAVHLDLNLKNAEVLCCGTTVADLVVPGHGQMVQGELADFSGEVFSSAGVCCSSMSALKTAYLSILANNSTNAIVTGSETASKFMRSEFFVSESEENFAALQKNPMVAFEHDFLRWMLSDGAAAMYMSDQKLAGKTNLKINWIEGRSYANEQAVCMYAGGERQDDGSVMCWKDLRLAQDTKAPAAKFVMNFRQDIRQLREMIPVYTVQRPLPELKKKYGLNPGDYTWFLPHYSSNYFRDTLTEVLKSVDFDIPQERWFTTLPDTGNIGSASMFTFIDQLIKTKSLNVGEKILCYIPESARFSVYYVELEVV